MSTGQEDPEESAALANAYAARVERLEHHVEPLSNLHPADFSRGDDQFVIVNVDKREYISPTRFEPTATAYGMGRQHFSAAWVLSLLILRSAQTMEQRVLKAHEIKFDPVWLGRWAGDRIYTAHKDDPHDWFHPDDPHKWAGTNCTTFNLFFQARSCFADLTMSILADLDRDDNTTRHPQPWSFRSFLQGWHQGPQEDYTWLTCEMLENIEWHANHRHKTFWRDLRKWLLRRQLAPEVRRELGGRPGRLAENLKRKQRERKHRNVQVRKEDDD